MTIKVKAGSNGNFSCDPETKDKAKGKGTITWQLDTKGHHFVEPGVTWQTPHPTNAPSPSEVFGTPDVKDNKITVEVDNPGGAAAACYPYILSIEPDATRDALGPDSEKSRPSLAESRGIIRNMPT